MRSSTLTTPLQRARTERKTRLNVLMSCANHSRQGGIDRLVDLVLGETAILSEGNVAARALTTRGGKGLHNTAPQFVRAASQIVAGKLTGRIDVLHLNVAAFGSVYRKIALAKIAHSLGIPYIVHIHTDRFIPFWQAAGPRLDAAIGRLLAESQSIIVLGGLWANYLATRNPLLKAKLRILPNATKPPPVLRGSRAGETPHIVCLGMLGPGKGTRVLLEALAKLKHLPDWRATLAGNGEVEQSRAYAAELGIAERVSLPGWIGPADAAALLAETDIFALPSNYEGLPMSILEAFANGVPVVATDVGAVSEVVEHGRNGLIVPRGDADALAAALSRLLSDPAMRERFGAAAKQKHEACYRLDDYVRQLAEIWRQAARS